MAVIPPPPPPVGEPMVAPVAPPPPPPPAAAAAEPAGPELQRNDPEPGQNPPNWMVGLLTPTVLSLLRLMVEGDLLCALQVNYTRSARRAIPGLVRFRDFEPSALLMAFVVAQIIGPDNLLAIPRPVERNQREESDLSDEQSYHPSSEESEGFADESD